MGGDYSIAIETSCRIGGLALGKGDNLLTVETFEASHRHATILVARLEGMLKTAGLNPGDLREQYISVGPGSFTALRVGVTVARTLAQFVAALRCVAVSTAEAVAQDAKLLDWEHLVVVMDAREGCIHATGFARSEGGIVQTGEPVVARPSEFLASAPRPLLLTGEGLWHYDLAGPGIKQAAESLRLPSVENVWRIGRREARQGRYTQPDQLSPIYARVPEVLRGADGRH